jgi:hypothetical protein
VEKALNITVYRKARRLLSRIKHKLFK